LADPTPVRSCEEEHDATREVQHMGLDDLDEYENDLELSLYREYRDVVRMFSHVVETERRFYLCNKVKVTPHPGEDLWFEIELEDAWVWDMYRPARFLKKVRVLTFRDVNVEELAHEEHTDLPSPPFLQGGR
jgi:hypothetical protein